MFVVYGCIIGQISVCAIDTIIRLKAKCKSKNRDLIKIHNYIGTKEEGKVIDNSCVSPKYSDNAIIEKEIE